MDRLHDFIGSPSEDDEGPLPLIDLRVLPALPDPRHPEGFSTRKDKLIFRLFPLLHVLPLEDRVGRNNATPLLEGLLPESCLHDVFGTSVEQELLRKPKCPSHKFDLAFPVFVDQDNRLDRIGSNVFPRLEVDLFETGADRKGICDALFIGASAIASTYG